MSSFFLVHRTLFKENWANKPNVGWLAMYLLSEAAYEEHEVIFNKCTISLKRGQLVTGHETITRNIGLSRAGYRSALKTLKNANFLTTRTTSRYTIITICKYDHYQNMSNFINHPNDHLTSKKRPPDQPPEQPQLKKVLKEVLKEILKEENTTCNSVGSSKKEPTTKESLKKEKIFQEDSPPYKLAKYLRECIMYNDPKFKYKRVNLQKWAVHIDFLIRLDKRNPKEIAAVIQWVQNDDFNKANVLSTRKLRARYPELRLKSMEIKNISMHDLNKLTEDDQELVLNSTNPEVKLKEVLFERGLS